MDIIRLSGPAPEMEELRKQLIAELPADAAPAVNMSAPARMRRSITDRSPLGHVEWVEIIVKIATGVLSTVVVELVKEQIRKRSKERNVKVEESEGAAQG